MKKKKQKHKKQIHLTPEQALDREFNKSLNRKIHITDFSEFESEPFDLFEEPELVRAEPVKTESVPVIQNIQPEEPSLLITVSKLCQLLDCSRSTVDRMEKSGELPGRVVIGGSVRYHRKTIEQWLIDKVKTGKVL